MTTRRLFKRLGQHFLADTRYALRLAELVVCEPDAVCIEVGPGEGSVTRHLAPRVPALIAVELDRRWVDGLHARYPQVEIIQGDILTYAPPDQPLVVVGAIPYQITSPLIERLTIWRPRLRRAYLLIQREVARRLAASPGTPDWGRLSCLAQYHFAVRLHWEVPPGAFRPPPRVHSQVVELAGRAEPPCRVDNEPLFFALIAQLFQQRRKTLWNALRYWDRLPIKPAAVHAVLAELHIPPVCRGETLSLEALARLANALGAQPSR